MKDSDEMGRSIRLLTCSVVLLASVACGRDGGASTQTGPLGQRETDGWTVTGVTLKPGRVASLGPIVSFEGSLDEPVILDSVELIEASPQLMVRGAVASTGKGESFVCVGSGREFSPPGCRVLPVEGWEVSSEAVQHGGFQIVLGISASDEGAFSFPAVALTYHQGDQHYRAVYLQGGQISGPPDQFDGGCPDDETIFDAQRRIADELGLDLDH